MFAACQPLLCRKVQSPGVFLSAPGDSQCPSETLGFLMPMEGGFSGDGNTFIRRGRRDH